MKKKVVFKKDMLISGILLNNFINMLWVLNQVLSVILGVPLSEYCKAACCLK